LPAAAQAQAAVIMVAVVVQVALFILADIQLLLVHNIQ
jgi:hypothetical protein